jgi:hypothetical protein
MICLRKGERRKRKSSRLPDSTNEKRMQSFVKARNERKRRGLKKEKAKHVEPFGT